MYSERILKSFSCFGKDKSSKICSPIIITNSDQTASVNFAEATNVVKGETKIVDVTMK